MYASSFIILSFFYYLLFKNNYVPKLLFMMMWKLILLLPTKLKNYKWLNLSTVYFLYFLGLKICQILGQCFWNMFYPPWGHGLHVLNGSWRYNPLAQKSYIKLKSYYSSSLYTCSEACNCLGIHIFLKIQIANLWITKPIKDITCIVTGVIVK